MGSSATISKQPHHLWRHPRCAALLLVALSVASATWTTTLLASMPHLKSVGPCAPSYCKPPALVAAYPMTSDGRGYEHSVRGPRLSRLAPASVRRHGVCGDK